MLSAEDIAWMKGNRTEITENRTITITGVKSVQGGKHPITGEPIVTTEYVAYEVVWNEVKSLRSGETMIAQGIQLEQEDVSVTFDIEADLDGLDHLIHHGTKWRIVSKDRAGIGSDNRIETIVRKVT